MGVAHAPARAAGKKKGGNVQPDNLFPNPSGCNRRSRIIKRTRVLCRKKERIKDERSCLLGWLGGWPFFGWGGEMFSLLLANDVAANCQKSFFKRVGFFK